MLRQRVRLVLAALLLVIGAAACDRPVDSAGPGPTAPNASLMDLVRGLLGQTPATPGYTLANDNLITGLPISSLSISSLVGVSGGTVEILGHRLEVPRGALLRPTVFTMTLLPTGNVEVYMTATSAGLLGRITNVGAAGFRQPVRVTLSYSRSTNVTDPSELVILRLHDDAPAEPLPSVVDPGNQTVTADLDHFSRYAVAFPH